MYQSSNAYQVYASNQVNTASRGRLLLILYDGALKFLKLAKAAMEQKDIPRANENMIKAENIIVELMQTLNFDAGEIAHSLYSLYDYIYREMVDANIHKDIEKVDHIYSMLQELRDIWESII